MAIGKIPKLSLDQLYIRLNKGGFYFPNIKVYNDYFAFKQIFKCVRVKDKQTVIWDKTE